MDTNNKESNEEVDLSNHAENHKIGAKLAEQDGNADKGQHPRVAGEDGIPNTFSQSSPNYGTFGVASGSASDNTPSPAAGTNPGGMGAPTTADPDQRGGVAQNQDTGDVVSHKNDEYESRRESYSRDDPRYGSGTRNWATNEPGNRTTDGPDPNEDNL